MSIGTNLYLAFQTQGLHYRNRWHRLYIDLNYPLNFNKNIDYNESRYALMSNIHRVVCIIQRQLNQKLDYPLLPTWRDNGLLNSMYYHLLIYFLPELYGLYYAKGIIMLIGHLFSNQNLHFLILYLYLASQKSTIHHFSSMHRGFWKCIENFI